MLSQDDPSKRSSYTAPSLFGVKRRLASLTSRFTLNALLIAMISLFTGVAFGGTAGYVLATAWVGHAPVASVQPAVNTAPFDLPAIEVPFLPPALPDDPKPGLTEAHGPVEAVNKVLPAVVTVVNKDKLFGEGSGSGFFISEEGYIVTNDHVVTGADELSIIYAEGGTASATLIGAAPEFDLAILKVEGRVPAVVEWGDSSALPLGASVVAIGSALGRYQNTVTAGVLSGFNRELGGLRALLQTDAAINQGNSGGPLINLQGQVIGINTLTLRGGLARAEGLNFAVPSNMARLVTQGLLEGSQVEPPFLGVKYQELNRGVLLREVLNDTPATAAGLQVGDIIISVNGRLIDERRPLITLLLEHQPGDAIIIELIRDDSTIEATLILGQRT
jgi:2-alkenal reductase